MSIWSRSQQLVDSCGCESGRDQWLQLAMVLLGSHAVGVVWHSALFDALGNWCIVEQFWQCHYWCHARTHNFLLLVCICPLMTVVFFYYFQLQKFRNYYLITFGVNSIFNCEFIVVGPVGQQILANIFFRVGPSLKDHVSQFM